MKSKLIAAAVFCGAMVSAQAGLALIADNVNDNGIAHPGKSGDKFILDWVTAQVKQYDGIQDPSFGLDRKFKTEVEDGPKSWMFPVEEGGPDFLMVHYGGGKTPDNYRLYDLRDPMGAEYFSFSANNGLSWYAGYCALGDAGGPEPSAIPEPGTYAMGGLLIVGAAGMRLARRRRRQ